MKRAFGFLFVAVIVASAWWVVGDSPRETRVVEGTDVTRTAPVPSSAPTTSTTEPEVVRSEPIEVNRTDLDRYSPAGQDECAWRLSKGGTNLKPWGA